MNCKLQFTSPMSLKLLTCKERKYTVRDLESIESVISFYRLGLDFHGTTSNNGQPSCFHSKILGSEFP